MELNYEQRVAEGYAESRREAEELLLDNSEVYKNMITTISDVFGEGDNKQAIDQKNRILILLSIAIATRSESSIEWTITRALNHSVSHEMIKEALDISLLAGGTNAIPYIRYAYNVISVRKLITRGSK